MTEVNIKTVPLGKCPFCGNKKNIYAGREPSSVMHASPPCKKFLALEPTEFLRAVRMARGGGPS